MQALTAIGKISESLMQLLLDKMDDNVKVTIFSPDEIGDGPGINLFLFSVHENPNLNNLDWQVKRGQPNQMVPPPLSLNLFYLMTPYGKNGDDTGLSRAHEILGDAMRVFHENPILTLNAEEGQGSQEQIKIMLMPPDMEELSQVWSMFKTSFRLSVAYEVSVVQLDVLTEHERTVKRVKDIGVKVVNDNG